MSEISDNYRRIAGTFTARVHNVPAAAWDNPAPCEGWVARDVVRHLVDWVPEFFDAAGGPRFARGPSVEDDPAGAWTTLSESIQANLDDADVSATQITHPMAGTHRFDEAIATFVTNDVLVHTWDLARATGLDEKLDAGAVHALLVSMEPMDEMLRASGQFGPRVEVAADADEQTRLIAFTGRTP